MVGRFGTIVLRASGGLLARTPLLLRLLAALALSVAIVARSSAQSDAPAAGEFATTFPSIDDGSADTEAVTTAPSLPPAAAMTDQIICPSDEPHLNLQQTLETASPKPTIKVGGVLHMDGTLFPDASPGIGFFENPSTGDDPENRLEFRRLRLNVSGDVHEDMFYKLEFEFADPNDPQVLDAYVGFRNVECLQTVILGNQLRPLSMEVYGNSNLAIFMEPSLVFGESNVDARRIGALARGYTTDESVNWQFGGFEFPNLQGTGEYVTDSFEGSLIARVTSTPWYEESSDGLNYLHVGTSAAIANPNDDAQLQSRPELRTQSRWIDTGAIADSNGLNNVGVEGLVNVGAFSFGGEWTFVDVSRTTGTSDLFFNAGYVYVAYFLTGESQPFNRKLGVLDTLRPIRNFSPSNWCCFGGAWQIAARMSYANLTDDDIEGGRELNMTLGLNWWFNPNSRLMFNCVTGTIDDHQPVGGYTSGTFTGLATRLQLSF